MNRRLFLSAVPVALLAGCGFQLRRLDGIPFASLYVDAPADSEVSQRVIAALKANKAIRFAGHADEAEAVLKLDKENRSKTILSLSGAGRVTEYRLGLSVSYTLRAKGERELAVPETIELSRDMTYDDSKLLAKSSEEALLYRDMEDSAARQIIRRLQAIKPGGGS